MSIHIGANKGDIADKILLPGDPLRAQFIAENFLENPVKYNDVRGMYGFTGTYKGEKVSVQGTGMGVPSISIYAHELINEYDVKKLIRVGTCGAFQDDVKVRDVILAMSASTDSSTNKNTFHGLDFAPTANFDLLKKAHDVVLQTGKNVHVGNVFTSDLFYDSNENFVPTLRKHGSLAVEMETAALYTLAARYNAQALSILTVSDHLITGELTSSEERQTTFKEMMNIALDTIIEG
ncbi:purine-nucleoside phosphorylase [Desertibacillus haloalkaliphilus]|uniref:purine-nucleoside phosphorylase n=1 Tax=Desertibacillus haloalkaliphilus TaxID=1328930 RepID=UPI001C2757B2|nr:purine-nucleoside phosphorylase [Desertibacillus haloalkaliphilus]MBU8906156.1 purine-nucleoside phosphorylase [Desertibacillus haloalkaliphilus]